MPLNEFYPRTPNNNGHAVTGNVLKRCASTDSNGIKYVYVQERNEAARRGNLAIYKIVKKDGYNDRVFLGYGTQQKEIDGKRVEEIRAALKADIEHLLQNAS